MDHTGQRHHGMSGERGLREGNPELFHYVGITEGTYICMNLSFVRMHIYVVLKKMGLDLILQEVTNASVHYNLKLTLFANIHCCKIKPEMCSLCQGQTLAELYYIIL